MLGNIVMKRLFERFPICGFLTARILHMKQNQLSSVLGSELMCIGHNLS